MRNVFAATLLALRSTAALGGQPAVAQIEPFPARFHIRRIATNGTTLDTRIGGTGPAVVLLHGYGETGDMWSPLAAKLAANHTVIVPDLRGMGLSARPSGGYDKKTQGYDVAGLLDALKIDKADLVTHDIGNMVGYAFAAESPARVTRFVLIDAPLPGVGPWDDIVKSHALWHFSFWGPDAERLGRVASGSTSTGSGMSSRRIRRNFPRPRVPTMPGCTRSPAQCTPVSSSFKAFDQDAIDNKAFVAKAKLTMPVLAVGGEKSFGPTMAVVMRAAPRTSRRRSCPNRGIG